MNSSAFDASEVAVLALHDNMDGKGLEPFICFRSFNASVVVVNFILVDLGTIRSEIR